jgi:hypothetical protein
MSQEFNWGVFLGLLKDNSVVPVLGSDLIRVKNKENGQIIPLYDYMTFKLSNQLKIKTDSLNLRDFIIRNKDNSFIDTSIPMVYREIVAEDNFVIEPLQRLARITDFNLYISTTIDNIFEKVLKQELGDRDVVEIDYIFPPRAKEKDPLPQNPVNDKKITSVFKILGDIRKPVGSYAIDDEEILEYIYSLNDESDVTKSLFEKVEDKNLLFLGCDFPDWLMRFFIRIITNKRFSISHVTKVIADNYTYKDSKFSFFLEQFKTQIIHFSEEQFDDPIVFINKLYDQWIISKESIAKRYEGSVFLSFNHKDVDIVRSVRNELNAHGIDAWFDETELQSGDAYNSRIRQKIMECTAFIAFISQNSLDPDCYTYKVEWDFAISRRKVKEDETVQKSFIKPIILDNTEVTDNKIPEMFRKLTIDKIDIPKLIQNIKRDLIQI